jgi:tRNA(fMet)-specific endonuclease VapC
MSLRYLVDSDWVIHWLNGHEEIRHRLDEVKEQGIALSLISLAEVYEGVYYGRDPNAAEKD